MFATKEVLNKPNEMVKVVLRCRPINEKEKLNGYVNVVKVNPSSNTVEIYNPKYEKMDHYKMFVFDAVYDFKSNNQEVYMKSIQPFVKAVLRGFNATIFAYGQSGAGKTYTMEGTGCDKGFLPITFEDIFESISQSHNTQYLVRASYLEIYQNEIRDLLSKTNKVVCELRENGKQGVYVKNLSSLVCKNFTQMKKLMNIGKLNRAIGVTDMNERSSRSHAVLTVTVEMCQNISNSSDSQIRVGKLNLVDLAGSERQSRTNAYGLRLREASQINLSLSALGNVISALADNKNTFIPYRDSILTRLLSNSLGGNSKTIMLANLSPASCNYEESLNTLRFASRARNIKNSPKINEDPLDALLKTYQEEIEKLKRQLAEKEKSKAKQKIRRLASNPTSDLELCTPFNESDHSNMNEEVTTNLSLKSGQESLDCKQNSSNSDDNKFVDDLVRRIQLMESKLLSGSNLLEHTCEQHKIIVAQNNEIEAIRKREKKIQDIIELHQETSQEVREDYTNLQQEVDVKSKELLKFYNSLQRVQQEINDVKEEFNKSRREIGITEYELLKDLKLKLLIMKNFIPNKERRQLLSRLVYNEDLEVWETLPKNDPFQDPSRPKSSDIRRRPVTLFTQITQRKANHIFRCNRTQENGEKTFRFRGENILDLNLYQPLKTTKDYEKVRFLSNAHSKLKAALQEEENINIDARKPAFLKKLDVRRTGRFLQPGHKHKLITVPNYPKARGLVPK